MVVVANWPSARINHWDALLKARAIENQCYVAAVNRVGEDGNGLKYNGHSGIFDMNGQLLMTLDEKEAVGGFSLNKEDLTMFRGQFRFLQDRDSFTV
jgi:predicted amidohydrolase